MAGSGYLTGLIGHRSTACPEASLADVAGADTVGVVKARSDIEAFLRRGVRAGGTAGPGAGAVPRAAVTWCLAGCDRCSGSSVARTCPWPYRVRPGASVGPPAA